ncbi:hypothetical protein, partial [Leclercia adecarboxylata]|uniref:hypothetical protein n=1 Tax=Leclercia adecarboxylata TaxID=83655 RepID=UPI00254E3FA3
MAASPYPAYKTPQYRRSGKHSAAGHQPHRCHIAGWRLRLTRPTKPRNTVGPCKRSAAGHQPHRGHIAGWRLRLTRPTKPRNTVGPCKRSAAGHQPH